MDNVIVICSDTSSDSIREIEPPKKLPPPLIEIDVDEIVLNVTERTTESSVKNCVMNLEIPEESSEDNPNHWTDEMKKFYNDDWGDEESFVVDKMQAKMDKHPYLWQVSERDLMTRGKKRRNHAKCLNCCQYGHTMHNCPEPWHLPKCHMCGQAGHYDKKCPNSICLNCGNQVRGYTKRCSKCSMEAYSECLRCSLPGHHFINCSDNWRRYHSTIGKIETDVPAQIIYKSASNVWCCNCGKRGHYELDCKIEKKPDFPVTSPFVASYNSVFLGRSSTFSVPAPISLSMNKITKEKKLAKRKKKKGNNDKSVNKLHQVKKRKKKKKKKEKDKAWKKFVETPDFIPI